MGVVFLGEVDGSRLEEIEFLLDFVKFPRIQRSILLHLSPKELVAIPLILYLFVHLCTVPLYLQRRYLQFKPTYVILLFRGFRLQIGYACAVQFIVLCESGVHFAVVCELLVELFVGQLLQFLDGLWWAITYDI